MFYLGSSNHELSEQYEYNLGLSKHLLIWLFSDIIYKLEEIRQNSYKMIINIDDEIEINDPFTIINNRVVELCMSLQSPIIKGEKTRDYGKKFNEFCIINEINIEQASAFIYSSTKRLKLKIVLKDLDHRIIASEMIHSANVVIPEIYRMKKML